MLEKDGIVADVDKTTPWVNNLVLTEKRNGSLRICLDPKPLNKAIKHEHFEIPTPEDVQARLAGKNLLSVIDMSMACETNRIIQLSLHILHSMGPQAV